jgi:hypothetical protein
VPVADERRRRGLGPRARKAVEEEELVEDEVEVPVEEAEEIWSRWMKRSQKMTRSCCRS